jgi:hypothetical protein
MTDSIGGMSLGKKKDLGQKFNLVATTKNVIRKKRKKNREGFQVNQDDTR